VFSWWVSISGLAARRSDIDRDRSQQAQGEAEGDTHRRSEREKRVRPCVHHRRRERERRVRKCEHLDLAARRESTSEAHTYMFYWERSTHRRRGGGGVSVCCAPEFGGEAALHVENLGFRIHCSHPSHTHK